MRRFINDLIMSSNTSMWEIKSKFYPWLLTRKEHVKLILEINRNQRNRWKNKETIPKQVLIVFRERRLIYTKSKPTIGISLKRFTSLLGEVVDSEKSSPEEYLLAQHILNDTVNEEFQPKVVKYPTRRNKFKRGYK